MDKAPCYGKNSSITPLKPKKEESYTYTDLKSSLLALEKQISQEELKKRRGIQF